jgi:hypothetical protein
MPPVATDVLGLYYDTVHPNAIGHRFIADELLDFLIGQSSSNNLHILPSTTSAASLNIPSGTAPNSPNDGDVWETSTHLYARINGVTYQIDQQAGTGLTRSVNVISANTNAGAAAITDYVYLVSGTTTLTLPTAVGNTNLYTVKNTGVATVSIATTSAQTIDGSASPITLPVANTSLDLISDNANWRIV